MPLRAELEDLLPATLGRQTQHRRVMIGVGRPDVTVGINVEAVRKREYALAPATNQPSCGVELRTGG